MKKLLKPLFLLSPLFLAACAITAPTTQVSDQVAAKWYSPLPATATSGATAAGTKVDLPHQGSVKALSDWWQGLGDPLLVELIASGQAASPSVTAATSRIAQARSAVVATGAASSPNLSAAASASRGASQLNMPVASNAQAGLQASWEIDLWGGNRAALDAAQARLAGSQAGWHEARVSVAAEVANTYLNLRTCEQLVGVAKDDVTSRTETSRLTGLLANAGFTAPANASLARASNAQSQSMLTMQRTQCDMQVKALVALTRLSESEIRQKMTSNIDQAGVFNASTAMNSIAIPALPAQL